MCYIKAARVRDNLYGSLCFLHGDWWLQNHNCLLVLYFYCNTLLCWWFCCPLILYHFNGPWGLSSMKDGVRTILVSQSCGKESNWFPVAHEEIKWALSLFQYLAGVQATGWGFWKWRIICEPQDEALCEKTACRWKIWKVILFWTSLKENCYGLRGKNELWLISVEAACKNKESKCLSSACLFVLPWICCFFKQNCAKSKTSSKYTPRRPGIYPKAQHDPMENTTGESLQ